MRAIALVILAATLAGCGSAADRPGRSGVPTNPFASNYPSVDPGAPRRDDGAGRRREGAAPRPPEAVPF